MVCGDTRPDAAISVAYRPLALPQVQGRWNVRHCNDRPGCLAWATMSGPWLGPPPRGDDVHDEDREHEPTAAEKPPKPESKAGWPEIVALALICATIVALAVILT